MFGVLVDSLGCVLETNFIYYVKLYIIVGCLK